MMTNHTTAEFEDGLDVKPAVNRKHLLVATERNSWIRYFVFRFFRRRPRKPTHPCLHALDEAVTHAIAVYEQTVDGGLARLAGRLTGQNMLDLLNVMAGPADASHLQDGWLATAIADSVGAESIDQLAPHLRELVDLVQGFDFLQLVALVDVTRQFWGNGHLLNASRSLGEGLIKLGLELRD